MPIQTRCPSCSAAVPSNAAWCSLCHADLRRRAEAPSAGPGAPRPSADAPDADVVLEDAFEPAGRHAAGAPVATRSSSGGRHAAGRRSASRPARATASRPSVEAVLEGIEVPTDADLTPEQVDALADQMLRRLAVTEKSATVLDPEDLPGGKWGFTAGLMAVIVVVLIAVGTIVGFVLSR